MLTKILKIAGLAAFLFISCLPLHAMAQNKILNVRHWAAPDHTRIVIDTSEDVPYTVEKAEKKILIHFKHAKFYKALPHEIILKKPGIDKVLVTALREGGVKVELFIDANVESKVFKLNQYDDKPDRVVIDIEIPDVEKQETQAREEVKVSRKNKIVVIDPGHGGDDPGAVGRHRTYEKRVVLEISRKLRTILNKKEGYRAFLTRDGDYYVPFKKRLKIAREYGADLFISIHADAFRRRDARGSSVYCLSVRGASSEAAKFLARRENLADIVGGSSNGESSDESDPIILNMFQTNTINSSKVFGSNVLRHLNTVGRVKFGTVQEAQFRVLKLPEIPSILVETAYISNPKEELLLRTSRYQMEIAKAIASAATEFLPVHPATTPEVIVTKTDNKEDRDEKDDQDLKDVKKVKDVRETGEGQGKRGSSVVKKGVMKRTGDDAEGREISSKPRVFSYRISKGDTLDNIAKKHGTTMGMLLKLNEMKLKDPLYAGRMLKIPDTGKDKAASEKVKTARSAPDDKHVQKSVQSISVYQVKKGDTLDKIARKNNTTIGALLKLNHMKMKDPLYAGKKLKMAGSVSPSVIATYIVKRGDTLGRIAKKYKTSVSELRKLNRMKQTDSLYVNQKLKLPQTTS
ncbi:MAG: N-acetylmuramoyl-L-alanine amidase [Deltaproteobacteria bacterium]|nr:N-acetylmuramoyl-L-alanine amidase [Deltaproteobacteria bacterium]